jgi:hypothetical protein
MTHDEVIEMARQVGKNLETSDEGYRLWTYEALEAFAKLVAAKATASEREACAKLLESHKTGANELMDAVRDMEAKAIRARGEQA